MTIERQRRLRDLAWVGTAVLAALVLFWAFPRAYPLFPGDWQISKEEATAIALDKVADLADLPAVPYVVTRLDTSPILEPRLQATLESVDAARLRTSAPGREIMVWEVTVYRRDSAALDWTYRVRVAGDGSISQLRMRLAPEEERPDLESREAQRRADLFLRKQGFNLAAFEAPEVRSRQLESRTDLALRYRDHDDILGDEVAHGVEVTFAGDQLTGYSRYYDDPGRTAYQRTLQSLTVLQQGWIFLPVLLVPLVMIPFVRRYHEGEIGIRRGLQIMYLGVACGVIVLLFCGRGAAAGWTIGVLTRPQITYVVAFQLLVLFFFPTCLTAFVSWSVGEAQTRERHATRLAAFDALFKGQWANSTFARATLRGFAGGLAVAAALLALAAWIRTFDVWASTSLLFGPWWDGAAWFSVPLVALSLVIALYNGLFGRLFIVSYFERKLGTWIAGAIAVFAGAILFFPPLVVFPTSWSPVFWLFLPLALVVLFVRYGLLTTILANVTVTVVLGALPFLTVEDAAMQLQAMLAIVVVAAPFLVSAKNLWAGKEFVYRYEDVPPHVRRIADRERQKVELETARRIQTSILPELPPQLNGVEMTHSYLPASEVGGDFYDVLALEDGRLAVAVGDVAGHGVSSGLVMSMAKSALAVQVTFNPEVAAVFNTLNRMVYQSARKRLLATLCYAVLDPERREMFYASAGHLFPYRISSRGDVESLESVSYPLGVRGELDVRVRSTRLGAGDYLFLFSDGVVEARVPGSDELFGFDRLERSLRRHAGGSVRELRRGVLADLEEFTGSGPREDDLTVLVLRVP